jgi:hypothetical protein
MKILRCVTPCVALAISLCLSRPDAAGAAYLRGTPSVCSPINAGSFDSSGLDRFHDGDNGGPSGFQSQLDAQLICPFFEYNCSLPLCGAFSKTSIQTLNVYVYDESTSDTVWAKACVHTFGTNFSCGSADNTGASGNVGDDTLQPSLSEWNITTGNAYIHLRLGDQSSFYGYYAEQ